jgi:hypothetical protein
MRTHSLIFWALLGSGCLFGGQEGEPMDSGSQATAGSDEPVAGAGADADTDTDSDTDTDTDTDDDTDTTDVTVPTTTTSTSTVDSGACDTGMADTATDTAGDTSDTGC